MFDLISTYPTIELNAQAAYAMYWSVATSDDNKIADGAGPLYRFAREYLLRAIMRDYELTIGQVAWLYDNVLPEGPGWGNLDDMVRHGRVERFGERDIASRALNCFTCIAVVNAEVIDDGRHHAINCPMRSDA